MKVFVAIPVFDGKLPFELVKCLLAEQAIADRDGDGFHVEVLPGCSHVAMGRNQLAHAFLKSYADKLVFLDSDMTFEPGALLKLAEKPVDFVGGSYVYKYPNGPYQVEFLKGDLWADENGLLEVASLPTGFLALSRNVFAELKKAHPDRHYSHYGIDYHCYFQFPFDGKCIYGEDFFFCKEWRETGGKILLDPELKLTHWNFAPTPYAGHIGKWLKSRFQPAGDACQPHAI